MPARWSNCSWPTSACQGGEAGREALRYAFEVHLRADRVSILSVGGHVINLLDRDHAAGTVYCSAEFGDQSRWIRQAIAYEDDYERRDSCWYFARRAHLRWSEQRADDTRPTSTIPTSP